MSVGSIWVRARLARNSQATKHAVRLTASQSLAIHDGVPSIPPDIVRPGSTEEAFQTVLLIVLGVMLMVLVVAAQAFGASAHV